MTERPLSITTQIATPIQIQASINSAVPVSAGDAIESVDEEPYTIKCICDYSDDDGNTIWCDTCATWQHIECFYPGRVEDASKEEFDHSCADCKPRPLELDGRAATERQKRQRQEKASNDSDKKSKRPLSKSHKKKTKPTDLQVNGFHDHDGYKNGSPQEQHQHTKKTKGHRPSQSSSSTMKRSPPLNGRPSHHAHPPSPAHTPPDSENNYHSYSQNFLALYDHEPSSQIVDTNSFANLNVVTTMSRWLNHPNPIAMKKEVGTDNMNDLVTFLKADFNRSNCPVLSVIDRAINDNGTNLHWRQLITTRPTGANALLGELNGQVGLQQEYCAEADNRWADLIHPQPFVFFPTHLPLYIDTRKEGSMCRYARRSCRPNAYLETFIVDNSEYHFAFVSERPLLANEQITIPWNFEFLSPRSLHFLNLGDEDGVPFDGPPITEEEYEQLKATTHLVLSDYGGCACDLGNGCAFARFHRNYRGRSHSQSNGVKPKRGRKPKNNHVSPTSTGHATNSRAPSEGQHEQFDEDDIASVSGSVRSKPRSRDLTPSHIEGNGILTEPSDREKRKLAMLEDTFRKMEQAQPPRKKKRASDGTTTNASTASHPTPRQRKGSMVPRNSISQASTTNSNGTQVRSGYADAGTSRRMSSTLR